MNTPSDEVGSQVTGKAETVAVDVEHDKVGQYDDKMEVTYPGGPTAPKTHSDPFTLGG